MCTIRRYRPEDKAAVKNICIQTANDEIKHKKEVLLTLYCDYYLDYESDHCFVLVNEEDEVVGYIIASYDYEEYHNIFSNQYLPRLRMLSESAVLKKRAEHILTRGLTKRFPAHLHIDILDGYRRMGYGTQLMNALVEDLKENEIEGLMLLVLAYNEGARVFFRRNGFFRVKSIAHAVAYVKHVFDDGSEEYEEDDELDEEKEENESVGAEVG